MKFTRKEIDKLEHLKKINLINSISGIKPANLIGTKSDIGQPNLAIISSVVHLGSAPPLFGFIMRPTEDVPRHTYENIKQTGYYTINHVNESLIEKGHYTSAKFDREVSEFERCNIEDEYLDNFHAPFVKDSSVKIGLKLVEELPIAINGTIMIIGEVQIIDISDDCLMDGYHLDLSKIGGVGISGLNSYYGLNKLLDLPYARPAETPVWDD
ncbi:flavin reductase family protein [Reichenbachiella versicolor]|uniref:flavin reductase family protein n=1 Tax=Reichenbachiella versicolor TaxID=1821036 RepID=UPI000D6DF669|nr:flavin reductase [Reichenbachiella versicolor]